MKVKIVPLNGKIKDNAYQLGKAEREDFLILEDRILRLISKNFLIRQGQDILSRTRAQLSQRKDTLFHEVIKSYCEGLGIETHRYYAFLSLFEHAAHYGQTWPELKGILPGCTSYFYIKDESVHHSRLIDFPLVGSLDLKPVLYLWQDSELPTVMNFSTPGLAPLFFQAIHASGASLAIHHKPGTIHHHEGESIFQIVFDSLFEGKTSQDIKKGIKKKDSITKWGVLILDREGRVEVCDIEGPTQKWESFSLKESGPLLFTNLPLQKDSRSSINYLQFTSSREEWAREKLKSHSTKHILDQLCDVEDQKERKWLHPAATLSTIGALDINLSTGTIDIKTGESVLTISDEIYRIELSNITNIKCIKKENKFSDFERAWKRAGKAQSYFDQGNYENAYHELQMAISIIPSKRWKDIFRFYLCTWDFRFIGNNRELADVYKNLMELELYGNLKDQGLLLKMRLERKLGLSPTVSERDLSEHLRSLFREEKLAKLPVFATWMNLLYPRMEILDVLAPHSKKG